MGKDLKGKELGKNLYQKKDGRYEARKKINGIDIYIVDPKLVVVKAKLKEAEEQAIKRQDYRKGERTLDEYFEEWFEIFKKPTSKVTSIPTMKRSYKNYFGCYIGKMKMKDILSGDVQKVINLHHEDGKADSTIRSALSLVQQCFERAKYDGAIPQNPCYDLTVSWEKEANDKLWRFLSKDERIKFLEWVTDSWYKEMFYFMLCTGVRVGELGALKWDDIDFKKKCVHVKQSLSCSYIEGEKNMMLTKPKTPNSVRDIPFMGECEEMLKSQQKKVQKLKKQLGDRWRSSGEFDNAVFVTNMGSPVTRHVAEKAIKRIVQEINHAELIDATKEKREPNLMENVFPHALRHTFCTICFEKGMKVKTVQKLMGHAHYSTTLDIYTHLSDDYLSGEIEKFGNLMTDSEGEENIDLSALEQEVGDLTKIVF